MQMLDAVINLKDNFSDTLRTVESNVGAFQRTYKRTGRDIQRTGREIESAGSTLTKGITLPAIAALGASAKLGMEFEKTMSSVKAVTGAAGDELESLEKKAREMGKNTTKSSSEAAQAMEYMGLAGWDTTQIISGIEPVLRLSEAGNIDLARASDLVTDSMSAMGIEVQDLDGYLDIVAQTARSSNNDIDAMMEAYLGVGGVLRGLDVELEDSAVALGMLANAGIKGSESGKSLSAILTNLTAPTGRAKKALDELGFSAFDAEGNFKGIDEVLFELRDTMKDMTPEQQNMYKSMIAGKEHTKGLNALINGLDDSYEELSESIGESGGALMTMAEIMNDNEAGSLSRLLSSVQEIALTIYDKMKPAIADVIDLFQGITDKLNNLTPEQEDMITKFVKMAIVMGPALTIIGKMTIGLGGLIEEFGFFAERVGNGGFLKAILKPGVKVALVFAALGAAAYLVYKNWDKIKPVIDKVRDSFNEFVENNQDKIDWVRDKFGELATTIKEKMTEAWSVIQIAKEKVSEFAEYISGPVETAKEIFISLSETIWEKIQGLAELFEPLKESFSELFSSLGDTFGLFKEYFSDLFAELGALFDLIIPYLLPIMAFIGGVFVGSLIVQFMTLLNMVVVAIEGIAGVLDGLIQIMTGVIDFVVGVFTGDWDRAWNGVKTIFDGVVQIITSIWETFVGFVTAPVDAVVDILDSIFHEKMQGIEKAWNDLKDFFKNPIKGTVNLAKKGWNALTGVGNNYEGTDNWRGGLTWVHEKGAEIMDLPSGTRIYPHDKSLQMAREQGAALASQRIPSTITTKQPRKQRIIPLRTVSNTRVEESSSRIDRSVSIAKLAETIIVREDADIDKIANAIANEIAKTGLNMA